MIEICNDITEKVRSLLGHHIFRVKKPGLLDEISAGAQHIINDAESSGTLNPGHVVRVFWDSAGLSAYVDIAAPGETALDAERRFNEHMASKWMP